MATLPAPSLVQAILNAFEESGASAFLISDLRRNPRRFVVQVGPSTTEIWIYVWTLTHGGGAARPRNEYRIQLTGVTPPLPQNPVGPTILVGYEPVTECFAGFDISKHQRFSTKSPSIQIPITALRGAYEDGFSFFLKGNDEIAVGVRPDQLLSYTLNANALHAQGANAITAGLLARAVVMEDIPQAELNRVGAARQRIIATVSRLAREAGFRRKVLAAYNHQCAVSGVQLRLVDAAHILPVGAKGSNDTVNNGLCLSPTYHRAYDRGLIYLDENHVMRVNRIQERQLVNSSLAAGLGELRRHLEHRIHLPDDRRLWPSELLIRMANHHRQILSI